MKTFSEHSADMAQVILGARDFCGNEREACREYLKEHGFTIGGPEAVRVTERAFAIANNQWAISQKEAGVNSPISAEERTSINRAFR